MHGGDLVIGADPSGEPTGLVTERDVQLLDEASLRDMLGRWLPPGVALRTAVHVFDGRAVVIVAVEPHPLGLCIMAADGAHADGLEFRAGDVFLRRGTQSVRWSVSEAEEVVQRIRRSQREGVRVEVRQEWEAAMRVAGAASTWQAAPLAALNWALDLDTFVETAFERLRAGDEIAMRRLIVGLPRDVALLSRSGHGIERTAELLDRVVALLGQCLVTGRDDLFRALLRRLTMTYQSALANPHPAASVPAVAELQGFLRIVDRHRPEHCWVLSRAAERAAENGWLLPDLLEDDERVISSLCVFDLLCGLAAADGAGTDGARLAFGNFAGWHAHRIDPAVLLLLDADGPLRRAIFTGDDVALARALACLRDIVPRRWGGMTPWDGFEDERITRFVAAHAR